MCIRDRLCSGLNAGAQQAYLSREEYRDKVEAYSQILKQQHLKTFARDVYKRQQSMNGVYKIKSESMYGLSKITFELQPSLSAASLSLIHI